MSSNFNPSDYSWFCDECDAFLNEQEGFDTDLESWECTVCGCVNYLAEEDVIDDGLGFLREQKQDDNYTFCYEFEYEVDDDDEMKEGEMVVDVEWDELKAGYRISHYLGGDYDIEPEYEDSIFEYDIKDKVLEELANLGISIELIESL